MPNLSDREFAAVILAIGIRRKVDRSMVIDVTSLFQPILDRLSMTELTEYILSRYPNRRGESRESKYDLVDIGKRELKSFGRGFAYKDILKTSPFLSCRLFPNVVTPARPIRSG